MNAWIEIVKETLIVVWLLVPLLGFFTYRTLRKKGKAQPVLRGVVTTITVGTALTLLGTFQRLRDKGIIEESLAWFLILALLLLVSAQGLQARLERKDENASEGNK
jgi:hypothetical protein